MDRKAEIKFHRQQIRHHQLKLSELMAPELGRVLVSRKKCNAEDDNGVRCENLMTKEEEKQDGMCCRCAESLWAWYKDGVKFVIKDPKTREFA